MILSPDIHYIDFHTHSKESAPETMSIYNHPIQGDYNTPSALPPLFSTGIHPWHISTEMLSHQLTQLQNIATNKQCVAIGECGLDKIGEVDFLLQEKVFRMHLEIAQALQKPIIIHCVKAFNETLKVLKEYPSVLAVFHGFTSNSQVARQLTRAGYYLSFGSFLLRDNHPSIDAFISMDKEYFLLESDDAPFSIKEIYDKASSLLNISPEELQIRVKQNFSRVLAN